MSGRTRSTTPVVHREYRTVPDACERAIEFLLKGHANEEGGWWAAPKDAKEIKSVRAKSRIP